VGGKGTGTRSKEIDDQPGRLKKKKERRDPSCFHNPEKKRENLSHPPGGEKKPEMNTFVSR